MDYAGADRRRKPRLVWCLDETIDYTRYERTQWYSTAEYNPGQVGLYEVGFEFAGKIHLYENPVRFWDGYRWYLCDGTKTMFPLPGDLFRGLKNNPKEENDGQAETEGVV